MKWGKLGTVAVILAQGGLGCGGAAPPPASQPSGAKEAPGPRIVQVTPEMGSPHVGDPAPDFTLPDQNGSQVQLASLKGSIVVLAFVTSWCPFSKAEQPNLAKLPAQYSGKNVKFIAVDVKEPETDYRAYLGRVAMPFPVLRDESGSVASSYAPPKALPAFKDRSQVVVTSNLVLDANGKIREFALLDTDAFDAEYVHVRAALDRLLAETAAK
jgi:peroxiredoxin